MKIFLSVPFTSRVDESGQVEASYRSIIEDLIKTLRSNEHEVFCALEHTGWKFGGMTSPEEEFQADLAEIDKTNQMIVLLEERISSGVQLESGYAFAKGKTVEMYQIGKPAWSNVGFSRLSGRGIIPVKDVADFARLVKDHNK